MELDTAYQVTVGVMAKPQTLASKLRQLCEASNGYATVAPIAGFAGFTATLQDDGTLTIEGVTEGDESRIEAMLDAPGVEMCRGSLD